MCGRYQLGLAPAQVQEVHSRAVWRAGHAKRYEPRNEVRPTTYAPVIVRGVPNWNDEKQGCTEAQSECEIMMMKVCETLYSQVIAVFA